MLNWKFVRAQFKNTWIIILTFGLTFAILVAFANVYSGFADKATNIIENNTEIYSSSVSGAWQFINSTIFGLSSLAVFISFGTTMSLMMINTDINRGYIGSWLTTPMSRTKIFNSKLFVLITSVLIINIWIVIVEMISFGIRMEDFKIAVGHLLLGNFTLLCYSLMIASGTWFVFSIFQKNGIALGIIFGLGGWFVLCSVMVQLSQIPDLQNLKYFKYFTIQSLFNSPLQFGNRPELPTTNGTHTVYQPILPIKALDFAWQLPVMVITATGLFTGGQFIIKNKDFAF